MRTLILILLLVAVMTTGRGQTSVTAVVVDPLAAGRVALEDGFAAMAEQSFRVSLEKGALSEADVSAARHYLLESLVAQEKFDAMLALLDGWASSGGVAFDVDVYWRATVLHQQSRYSEAAELLQPFSKTWPNSHLGAPALRLLGLASLKSGNVQSAVDAFEAFAEKYPKSDEASLNRLDWGKALIFQQELKKAIGVLQPIMLDEDAGRLAGEARYWIGKTHMQSGDIDQGQAVLAPLVANPDISEELRVKVSLVVAKGQAEAGDTDKAIQLLGDTLSETRGDNAKRRLSHALCGVLLTDKRLEEAIPLVKAYVTASPDAVDAAELQLQLGNTLLGEERYEEAIEVYQQFLETFANAGGHAQARQGHGWALMGVGRYAEAATAFEKAFDLFADPKQKMDSLYKVGDARFANAQYQQALAVYQRFLETFPEAPLNATAMFQVGACYAALEQHDAAERAFEAVAEAHPDAPEAGEALLRIGELRQLLNDWKGAEAAFVRVMDKYKGKPIFARALHGRGLAHYYQWSPDALADFERVVAEFPGSGVADHAFFMRAMCLYRLGRDAQALSSCREFLERSPDSEWAPSVRFWVGRFAYNTGAYEEAETEFLAFVEQYPEHDLADQAVYRAGMAATKRKEYVRAVELFGQLAKSYPESERLAEARFHQADAMCQLGKFSGAILVFEEVINNYPTSEIVPLAWGRKGDCQFTLGADDPARYEEAIRSYRVVTQSPHARVDHIWQAEYKVARCLEKLDRKEEALDHYYAKVMVPFLMVKNRGEPVSESAKTWFTRASLGAADLVTDKQDWRQLVRILDRIVEADVAVSAEASARIKTVKSENWWLFY
jgi:TolA-binding protein